MTTTVNSREALPANYSAIVTPHQDAVAHVANKGHFSFDVILTPRLATNSIGSGSFDVQVLA